MFKRYKFLRKLLLLALALIAQKTYTENFFSLLWTTLTVRNPVFSNFLRPVNRNLALQLVQPCPQAIQAKQRVHSGQIVSARHMDIARAISDSVHRDEVSRELAEKFFNLSPEEKDELLAEAEIYRLWKAFRGFQF